MISRTSIAIVDRAGRTTSRWLLPLVAVVLVIWSSPVLGANVLLQNGATSIAFEAEDFFNLTLSDWKVVTAASPIVSPAGVDVLPVGSDASGDAALLNDFGTGTASIATYRIHFDTPGTYQTYLRYSMFENSASPPLGDPGQDYYNEDSLYLPTTWDDLAPSFLQAGLSYSNVEGVFGWKKADITPHVVNNSQLLAQTTDFNIRPRETGFVIDRVVLSTNTNLSNAQLDALSNSIESPVVYYTFEPNDTTADGLAADRSFNQRDGTLQALGTGSYSYVADTPTALATASTRSMLLVEDSTGGGSPPHNAAQLHHAFSADELDLNNDSWTFSGWFNRDVDTAVGKSADDMILHMGAGDGFGGGNELYIYGSAADRLTLHSYYTPSGGSTVNNVNIVTTDTTLGDWYHVALVNDAENGIMSLYLDGDLIGSDSDYDLNLSQGTKVAFGGHTSNTFRTERWFDGMLDDLAIWDRALLPTDISALADGTYQFPTAYVPEPSTLTLLLFSLLGLAFRNRRRSR